MKSIKKLDTEVLKTMVSAHSAYYGRALTQEELDDCKRTISLLQAEIENRKNALDVAKAESDNTGNNEENETNDNLPLD